jgi:hypothetical protein
MVEATTTAEEANDRRCTTRNCPSSLEISSSHRSVRMVPRPRKVSGPRSEQDNVTARSSLQAGDDPGYVDAAGVGSANSYSVGGQDIVSNTREPPRDNRQGGRSVECARVQPDPRSPTFRAGSAARVSNRPMRPRAAARHKGSRWHPLRSRATVTRPADPVRLRELLRVNRALFIAYVFRLTACVLKDDLKHEFCSKARLFGARVRAITRPPTSICHAAGHWPRRSTHLLAKNFTKS